MLLNVLQCTGRPPVTKEGCSGPNIKSPEVEEAYADQIRTLESTHNHVGIEVKAVTFRESC